MKSYLLHRFWNHSRLLFLPIRPLLRAESAGAVPLCARGSPWSQPSGRWSLWLHSGGQPRLRYRPNLLQTPCPTNSSLRKPIIYNESIGLRVSVVNPPLHFKPRARWLPDSGQQKRAAYMGSRERPPSMWRRPLPYPLRSSVLRRPAPPPAPVPPPTRTGTVTGPGSCGPWA